MHPLLQTERYVSKPFYHCQRHDTQGGPEVKFLGVIFDRKLSFLPHIKSLRLSCQKALDILRVVGHVSWGADRTVLLRLYRALIRSKLDYGSIIYGSAREAYLKILDPIHHQGLRICLGAFRTTPVQSLYAEAGEPPLSLRRLKLMLSYACRLKSHPGNPAYRAVFRPQRAALYAIRTKEQKPLSLRVAPHLQAAGVDIKQIEPLPPQTTPPWTLPVPEIRFDLTTFKKGDTSDPIYLQHFRKLISDYPQFCSIFTDGSKIPSGGPVAAAAVPSCQPQRAASVRLADEIPHGEGLHIPEPSPEYSLDSTDEDEGEPACSSRGQSAFSDSDLHCGAPSTLS
ncbi:hypothetical protein C0Q70_02255 [Pomacea canaliculata]|uniref:Reverse transcriptase domain-containing protein n=1 Tax=Pomacea canaliculata TaxID=400727 RepID=A0A2T7PPG1_POMCA|nr:hypothetical protein C0Q70_02255 [Pomacea canaliculata]